MTALSDSAPNDLRASYDRAAGLNTDQVFDPGGYVTFSTSVAAAGESAARKRVPPGLAKKGGRPPGLAKGWNCP